MNKVGDRVRLVVCTDPHEQLTPGQLGTVNLVDGFGTVHVDWDDGHKLGLIPGEDRWDTVATAVQIAAADELSQQSQEFNSS